MSPDNAPSNKFLRDVARYYLGRPVANLVMVFPNKRGAMFMRQYMRQNIYRQRGGVMPVIKVMPSFMARHSDIREVSTLEMKFVLYDCYIRVMTEMGAEDKIRPFDSFAFWADLIISDFDDIDANMVDADALFHNLESLKEIQSFFLTPEQADAFEQMWGYRPASADEVEDFWRHVPHPESGEPAPKTSADTINEEFYNLWRILGRLYRSLSAYMTEHAIGYRGRVTRDAVTRLINMSATEIGVRYCFVGFDNIDRATRQLFKHFERIGVADFFWDIPTLSDELRGIHALARRFKSPEGFTPSKSPLPAIEVVGVPSNYMQAKVAADKVKRLVSHGCVNTKRSDSTAVILPDPTLLTPLMYALDDASLPLNVTMSLPLRTTPAGTLMRSLVSLHLRARVSRGRTVLFCDDLLNIISHPIIHSLSPEGCDNIAREIATRHLYTMDIDEIQNAAPALAFIFDVPPTDASADETSRYLRALIENLSQAHNKSSDYVQVLTVYADAITKILDLAVKYNTPVGSATFMIMLERLIYPVQFKVNGHPVTGIQIMGVLETRAIDFENVIFMSLNERVFPKRYPLRTLLPHILRRAFHMTTVEQLDQQSAYYFYRLLSRARHVTLLYDSRTSDNSSGECSRFISQLRYLLPPGSLHEYSCSLSTSLPPRRVITVNKDENVRAQLRRYMPDYEPAEKRLKISASALKHYISCPLQFYLRDVCKLSDEDKASQFTEDSTFGKVVHEMFNKLLNPYIGSHIDGGTLKALLGRDLKLLALSILDKEAYFGRYNATLEAMPGEARILVDLAESMVVSQLRAMIAAGESFTLLGNEVPTLGPMTVNIGDHNVPEAVDGKLAINYTGFIDRLDMLDDGRLRVVDYKTGSDSPSFTSVEALFDRAFNGQNGAVFQLLSYGRAVRELLHHTEAVAFELYRLQKLSTDPDPHIYIGRSTNEKAILVQDNTHEAVAGFDNLFDNLIAEIFDIDSPFTQTDDAENCKFCAFKSVCMR